MRKRRPIVFATAFVAVLGLIWWTVTTWAPAAPDPIYNGHPLSYWMDPSSDTHTNYRPIAVSWFPALDTNALPRLIQTLQTRDGLMRKAYDRLWPHFPGWLKAHVPGPTPQGKIFLSLRGNSRGIYYNLAPLPGPRSSAGERVNSCYCLSMMGVRARPAIPDLIRLFCEEDDGEVRTAIVWALANVAGPDDKSAIEALTTAATKDKYSDARDLAGWELARIAPEAAAKAGVK